MRTRSALFAFIAAILFLFSAPAYADEYDLDRPHTQIMFFIGHMGFSISQGEFTDYEGHFSFDKAQPEKSAVEATIRTASLQMGDAKWDRHMKSADFFNVEKFPEMTFRSTDVRVLSEDTADITGDLTILGMTKPVVLHTKLNKVGAYPMGNKYAAGFSATAKIKRSDFGMSYGIPMVADDVDIRIEVEAIRRDSESRGPLNP